jgi:hypothetical protein
MRIGIVVLIGLGLVVPSVSAQTTAAILGTVQDDTGGVLPGAEITVTNVETGVSRTSSTDERGRYRVTNLNIGQYEITASLSGFQSVVRRGILLTIGREAVVDLTLRLGELSDQVTVTGDAPLVDTTSGSLGGIVDRDTILQIPLNGRDLTGLITLQAGIAEATTTSSGANQGFSRKFSISGARPNDNAVLMDGTEVKGMDQGVPAGISGNFLGAEAIQEFKVERNSYSAQFGGNSGGVVNVVSKSGTNEFGGSAYGFFRDGAMDAAPFRAPVVTDASGRAVGKEKPDFERQQFGASFGGRIIQNRTFFFTNYEGLRDRLGFPNFVTTFSAEARRGSIGGRPVQVDPAVIPYLDLWPLPADAVDLGDGTARYAVNQLQPTDEHFGQVRVDHNFSDADAMFVRVTRQTSERSTPQSISRWGTSERMFNTFVTAEERKVFSSRLLNTVRFGFNRRGVAASSFEDPGVDPALFMVPPDRWLLGDVTPPIMGSISVTGVADVGLGRGWVDYATNKFQVTDDLVYNRGGHSLKAGFSWLHTLMGGYNPSRPGGELSFGSIEAFLRGQPRQFRGDILPGTDSDRFIRWNIISSYLQYDWQVNSRLTTNVGLRHEFYTVPTERDGELANLRDPLTDSEVTVLGTRGDSWWKNPSFRSFQPRIGFSWDPTGSAKMAVRGGAGIFYNHIQPEAFRQAIYRTQPFALETNFSAREGVMPFPDGLYDFIVGLGAAQGDLHLFPYDDVANPHMIQWNFNVQREVLPQTSVTLGYAGSRGRNLMNEVFVNTARADLIDGRYVFPIGATRPNPAFNLDLRMRNNTVNSYYHSLQLEGSRRFQAGWMLQATYTFSRTIDDASQYMPTFQADGGGETYYWDLDLRRGLAAFHVKHRFSVTGLWVLPFGADQRIGSSWPGWLDGVFGGWQLGGQLSIADGSPLTITMGRRSDLAVLGLKGDNPDLVPGGNNNPVLGDPDHYFDTEQFAVPPARTIGDLGRNTLIGPGLVSLDLGLTKNMVFSGRTRLQFRVEVFNVLNRVNLGVPNLSVFNAAGRRLANAGFIESTSTTARQLQLGARFEW